jgi:hypothetical protein
VELYPYFIWPIDEALQLEDPGRLVIIEQNRSRLCDPLRLSDILSILYDMDVEPEALVEYTDWLAFYNDFDNVQLIVRRFMWEGLPTPKPLSRFIKKRTHASFGYTEDRLLKEEILEKITDDLAAMELAQIIHGLEWRNA